MTSKFLRLSLAAAALVAISAPAQTGSAPAPASPAATPAVAAPALPTTTSSGTRVGTINVEAAVVGCNEGRRDFDALSKKLEPKQNELKSQNDELQALQKQLQTQQDKLNADALGSLQKQIDAKKKVFDRAVQDAQEDAQGQQQEIFRRILQKMAPVITKYAQDNGFGMIVDTSTSWPQNPVLWAAAGADITRSVVETYNTQSGVPAPASAATPKPATPKPATGAPASAPKPTTPKPTEAPK